MGDRSEYGTGALDNRIAGAVARRRERQPDRRRNAKTFDIERRVICRYCFQYGDHRCVADCMRALDRSERILNSDDE